MISCRSRSRSSVAGREASLASCGAALRVVGRADDDGPMTVIKINAITVPAEHGEEVARRFAARIGAVDSQAGFEGFELLRPTDEFEEIFLIHAAERNDFVVFGSRKTVRAVRFGGDEFFLFHEKNGVVRLDFRAKIAECSSFF